MRQGGMVGGQELDDQAARQHFFVATRYLEEGAFVRAAEEYVQAYRLSRRPQLLFNAYVAYRDGNERAAAARLLRQYLTEMPEAPNRTNLEARLVQLEAAVAEEAARAEALAAERERLAAEQARAQAERARALAAAQRAQEVEQGAQAWPWIITGVGVAALVAGAVVGAVALADASSLNGDCPDGLCPPLVDLEGRRSSSQTLGVVSDGLFIGGGITVAAGLVLGLLFGLPRSEAPASRAEQPIQCGPFGCAATMRF